MEIHSKLRKLEDLIRPMRKVLVGFSGGVDSTFLLKVCVDVLGPDRVLAVTTYSEVNTEKETGEAVKLARIIQAQHLVLPMSDLDNEIFASNPPDRCYYCKHHRYKALIQLAREKDLDYVLDGANYSDLDDYRPGTRALIELGIRSPLQEAMLTKEEIRKLSRQLGLPTWDQPARACLASRVPYGTTITSSALQQIARAEEVLLNQGLIQCRVRYHGPVARIEVPRAEFARLMEDENLETIITGIKAAGYQYVTLDLEGYRTGSLNELLNSRDSY